MDRTDTLREQLAALAKLFSARLDSELPTLEQLARQLPDTNSLQALRDLLHKLAGAAGTFGYQALGEKARELELIAQASLEQLHCDEHSQQQLLNGIDTLSALRHDNPPAAATSQANNSLFSPPGTAHRILILEDDQPLALRMRQTLESFGYHVEHVLSAQALDRAVAQQKPDALVIDISPGTSGHELLSALQQRQAEDSEPIPLIAISNRECFDTQLQAVRAGACGFFTKPVDLAALENRLERCFNKLQSDPFRVLIVDDDIQLAGHFSATLEAAGMLVEVVSEPRSLLEQMEAFMPEVILMDLHMPDYEGTELAQLIRLNDDWLRVPIIYLSAETDVKRQMAALLKAGDDFITKPISDSALLTTAYSRAQRARLVSQALSRDSLTGLLKHADIKEQMEIEIERARRTRQPVSVAMIDIDHFKQVNDRHGHAVGDNVICALANLLRQRLRKIDRLGRYGGEEFVAVLPNCSAADARQILDEIRQAFGALTFSSAEGLFQCSFSAGISACQAPDWQSEEQLEQADARLYQAKTEGRNRVIN